MITKRTLSKVMSFWRAAKGGESRIWELLSKARFQTTCLPDRQGWDDEKI